MQIIKFFIYLIEKSLINKKCGRRRKALRSQRRIVEKPNCFIDEQAFKIEASGKRGERGKAGTLDVTAFTLATLFRTVPVDEWYNQRSRGTPAFDERRGNHHKGE